MTVYSRAALIAAVSLVSLPAGAGWLSLCDKLSSGADGRRYLSPDGGETTLLVADAPVAGCGQVEIPVPADSIRWAGLIPQDVAARLDAGVSLLGEASGDNALVSEVIPTTDAPPAVHTRPVALVLGANTLPQLDLQLFGNPGRASVQREAGGLTLSCKAGANASGVLLTAEQYVLPVGASLQAIMRYAATGDFSVAFSDTEQLAREAPVRLGQLAGGSALEDTVFRLPPVVAPEPHGFSVLCPKTGAKLQLRALELRAGVASPVDRRATWVWQGRPALDDVDAFVAALLADDIQTLFLAVPLAGQPLAVANPNDLGTLIERADELGIETWAVEGDPAAVTKQGRAHFLQRTRALAAFNARQDASRRLHGVQYDIEPYLLPGFDLARNAWLREYLDTLRELRNELAVPMEAAVPFWWSGLSVDGKPLLTAMQPLVDGLTIMNYRTNLEQLQRLAEPYLAWGAEQQRYVRIALESVALPDQSLTHFRRGRTGRLWQLQLGEANVLVLLDKPAGNPAGPTFARAYTTQVPASGTTFRGQREQLNQVLPELVRHWSAWPSFAGPALHGYLESYD